MKDEKSDISEGEYFDVILEDVETGIRPRKPKSTDKKLSDNGGGWQFVSVAGQVGFDIALPMVLGLVVGVKLDERWGTRPNATLILFGLGLVISCASLIRIVRDALRRR
mgnify:FL=1